MGQRGEKKSHVIAYESKTLNSAQCNYTTIEKELLSVVFALVKFRSYIIGSKIVVFSDHAALRYFMTKKESKLCLLRWILLLQEVNMQIKDCRGSENSVVDHLSKIVRDEEGTPLNDDFPDE